MHNIHIDDSYKVWDTSTMKTMINEKSKKTTIQDPEILLNRTYKSMYIEWWLHNIGYYLTLPFNKNEKLLAINHRCKDVDLNEWK